MLNILPPRPPPRPPMPTRVRTQVEAFFVLRRNPLELWGAPAYEELLIEGRFLGRKQLMVNAPEGVRQVLVTNAANYRRNRTTRRVLSPILGRGLLLAEGEAWRHQRRTIAPALAPRTMPILTRHILTACTERESILATQLHRPIQLLPHMQALALSIAGQSMFSLAMADYGEELRQRITAYGLRYSRPGLLDLVLTETQTTPTDRARAKFRVEWLAFLDRLIASRPPADPDRPRDLLDLLIAARDPETGAAFTPEQVRDEVSTMILAGHETTAVALFWALYLLALNPNIQAEIAREGQGAAQSGEPATDSLPMTRAAVDETLRLYPPAFLIVREAIAPDTIAGRPIAPGTVVTIAPWILHRHRRFWTDPDAFVPARFLPGAPPPEKFAYLPFGAGPRICVGAAFALTEAVLVLARLLAKFEVRLVGSGAVVPVGIITTQPDRPVWFELSPRRL
jgi:unspecific monooxygenase